MTGQLSLERLGCGGKIAYVVFLVCVAMAVTTPAQTFHTLASFNGTNGSGPAAALVQGWDGNFYGTTVNGGTNNAGTVFRVTRTGKLATLYSFCGQPACTDGSNPGGLGQESLLLANDGNFYGTTRSGGNNAEGTVFKITPRGALTTVYSFCSQTNCMDGAEPDAGLIRAIDGNFYGTTAHGGGSPNCSGGCGTVFKLTPGGVLTTLYSFCSQNNCGDGSVPYSELVQATDGSLYGTTSGGGFYGDGTIFKLGSGGALTILYSFCAQGNCSDGVAPFSGLLQAADGDLYGTTYFGGTNGNYGTVFKATTKGQLNTLYSFCGQTNCADGKLPAAAKLVQGTDGNFYGITQQGGDNSFEGNGAGTVYSITAGGILTTLHKFCTQRDCTDGLWPYTGLLQATDGNFYGTTYAGGASGGNGMIFSLSMDLAPFVTFVRAAGKIGQSGGILGQGFTGTTDVSLNGVPANFIVVSDTYIKATVPLGATTGFVTVTTPSGILTSNVPFHVIP